MDLEVVKYSQLKAADFIRKVSRKVNMRRGPSTNSPEDREHIESAIATAVQMYEPNYSVWCDVLNQITAQYAPDATHLVVTHEGSPILASPGTIWVATQLVTEHDVPLDEILAAAALCFAGAPPNPRASYL